MRIERDGRPACLAKYLKLEGMEAHLFDRWLALFAETCNDLFEDTVAKAFIAKAGRYGQLHQVQVVGLRRSVCNFGHHEPTESLEVLPLAHANLT